MKTYYIDNLDNRHYLENIDINIDIDECFDFNEPFEDDLTKIDIMEHRNYNFNHDLNLKHEYLNITVDEDDYYFEDWRQEQLRRTQIQKDYYVFGLDYFEHSLIRFSLVYDRQDIGYYEFDRTRNVGYIAVKKSEGIDHKKAVEIARNRIEEYNSFINGRIYQYSIKMDGDYIDSCTGYFSEEDAKNGLIESIEYMLKNQGISYKSINIE